MDRGMYSVLKHGLFRGREGDGVGEFFCEWKG